MKLLKDKLFKLKVHLSPAKFNKRTKVPWTSECEHLFKETYLKSAKDAVVFEVFTLEVI